MKASIGNRIVLIGAGDVGIVYGYALVNQGLADHLATIDIDHDKLVGEVMDLGSRRRVGPRPGGQEHGTVREDRRRHHGTQDGIFIGVPAVIGRTGGQRVVELELDTTERKQFARSASALRAVSEQFEILR